MQKKILYTLIILIFAGCGKKSVVHEGVKHVDAAKKGRTSTYDEEVGAFVLHDDSDFDIFDDEAADTSSHKMHEGEIKWTDFDDIAQDEGHTVHFDYDSDRLHADDLRNIKENIGMAKEAIADGAKVLVEGHSCLITHSEVYNTALSQRRAERVAKEYEKGGIPRHKMKVVGRGCSMVLTRDEGKEAQGANRRVETKFIYMDNKSA